MATSILNIEHPEPITITASTEHPITITINENASYRIGRLVVINVRLTLNGNLGAGASIAFGCPPPAVSPSFPSSNSIVALATNRSQGKVTIIGGGSIIVGEDMTAQMYLISGSYIAAT